MSSIKKFLSKNNPHKRIVEATGTEAFSPAYKYLKPSIEPDVVEEDASLEDTIVMPTEDDPDVRKAMLEEERRARAVRGRKSTKTPGYSGGLGSKTILG